MDREGISMGWRVRDLDFYGVGVESTLQYKSKTAYFLSVFNINWLDEMKEQPLQVAKGVTFLEWVNLLAK